MGMAIKIKTGKLTLKQNFSLLIIFKPIIVFNRLIFLYPISIKLNSYHFIITILLTGCLSLNQLSKILLL